MKATIFWQGWQAYAACTLIAPVMNLKPNLPPPKHHFASLKFHPASFSILSRAVDIILQLFMIIQTVFKYIP
jgi:hypothetical protein